MTKQIKLLVHLDVDRRHKCFAGKVYETVPPDRVVIGSRVRWWIVGARGEKVGVLGHEAVSVEEPAHAARS